MTLPRIGVFDSGVGGLTVLKAMAEQLPAHYLYFGDTARLPYGTKSAETVARYAIGATKFLEAQNIDLLVIACNTATALALRRHQGSRARAGGRRGGTGSSHGRRGQQESRRYRDRH